MQYWRKLPGVAGTFGAQKMESTRLLLALVLAVILEGARCAGPPDDNLCKLCECSGNKVLNCTERRRTELPAADSGAWPQDILEAIFDHNNITEVIPLGNLTSLLRISFRWNNIDRIAAAAFQHLSSLREIDLSFNKLTFDKLVADVFKGEYTPTEFLPLGNVTVLRLNDNLLHSLLNDAFEHIPHLRVLSLAHNDLKVLDATTVSALATLAHLEVLDLSYCRLKDLPEYLLHTPLHLRELNLTGNQFLKVPSALGYSHTLKVLRLSENPIEEITSGSLPAQLSALEVLELDRMSELRLIGEGAFGSLKSLKEISITHCKQLKHINPRAFSPEDPTMQVSPLEKLSLRGNALKGLDQELLGSRWRQLTYLDLQDNAWVCDCGLQWMVEMLEPVVNHTHPDLLRNIICEDPEPMRGRALVSLHDRHYELRCLDADGARPDRDGLLLIGVLIGVLLSVPATLAGVLCWRRGWCPWMSGSSLGPRAFYTRARTIDETY